MRKWLAIVALFFTTAAYGQNPGPVTNHAFAIGKGPGVTGYTSLLCASGTIAIGSAGNPTCRALSGDVIMDATGVVTLATVNANVGTFGSTTNCVTLTADGKGRITAASQAACAPSGINQLTGDVTAGPGTGSQAATLATVNANVGSFGSATQSLTLTLDAKGRVTAASAATVTPAIGSVTGLGAGCATFLGTPSSANLRGCLTDETGTGLAYFQGGDIGTPSAGVGTNFSGTAASLTAGHVTTNANLTGDTTSVGNATTTVKLNGLTPGGACSANNFASSLSTSAVPTCTIPGANSATLSNAQPGNPTGTTSATTVMMGLGTTCKITPVYSTRVQITIDGDVANSGVANTAGIKLFYGTGTAPINGAASTGTQYGQQMVMTTTAGNAQVPFSKTAYVTGLSVGVAIWIDIGLLAGAGTSSISNLTCGALEY